MLSQTISVPTEKGRNKMRTMLIKLKCTLLVLMLTAGFLFTYACIWFWAELPETWWVAVLLAVLSALSTIGLILWIGKEDHVSVRCRECRYWTRHAPGKEIGTCFRRGFMHGVDKRENGYCDRGEPR